MAEENNVASVQDQPLGSLGLYSFNRLEFLLGFTREHLRSLASSVGSEYAPYRQHKKPRPFQKTSVSRKVRIIDNPSPRLKLVQRSINKNLLRPLQYPDYLCGGIRGKSVLDNVAMHMGQRTLVTMDIRAFFPSVDNRHVYAVWSDLLGCSPRISRLLTQLTTFERHLPQGAPTSTLLANLVLFMVDNRIRTKCQDEGVIYSSWIDDLAFSGDKARDVIQIAIQALREAKKGLTATLPKSKFESSHCKQTLYQNPNRNKNADPARIGVLRDQRESKDLSWIGVLRDDREPKDLSWISIRRPDSNRHLETIRNVRNPFKITWMTFSNRPKNTRSGHALSNR